MMYNKEKFINVYLILMSIGIISLFIYFRIILKRSSYSLEIFKDVVDIKYFLFCLSLLLLHVCIILFTIYTLKNTNKTNSILIENFRKIIDVILWKPLDFFITKISPYIPYSGTIIINYCNFFRKNEFRLFLMKFLCFCCYFLPRILMSCLFFIEIIYYHQLKYFIYIIYILLIPVIYMIFINLCEKFYDNNITDIENVLIIIPKGIPNQNGVYLEHFIKLKEESQYSKEDLCEFADAWDVLFYLINLTKIIRVFISKYSTYSNLFISILYVFSFSYKIYYLFLI